MKNIKNKIIHFLINIFNGKNQEQIPEFKNELYTLLIVISDNLNKEIIDCNKYLERNYNETKGKDEILFTRGKSMGLITAREKIENLLNYAENKNIEPNLK
jgi:hypothetical protein